MADDLYGSNKRKFDDDQGVALPPPTRRVTGFSAPLTSPPPETAATASAADDFLAAKQRAQEIASRILRNAEANQSKPENGDDSAFPPDHSQRSLGQPIMSQFSMTPPSSFPSYGYQGPSKKIEIPNGRVGVIIGKGGENIKNLQLQSGAKIQVTRDMDADPHSQTRLVEIVGNSEQINKAEQLINEVLAEADAGSTGVMSGRRVGANVAFGAEQFSMKVPNNKVGLIIGKGGETIKSMQANSGARIQIIPLHLPLGDTSQERTVQIDGTKEQIEAAKQLVNEVTSSEHRLRNPQMAGGYSQQGYHPRPPTWGPPGAPQMQQQPGYGYMQPGAYPAQPPQYNTSQPAYGGYPASYPDQTSNQQTQQTTGTGYDYYGQQQPPQQQPVGGSAAPADNNSYNYTQPPPNYTSQGSYGDPAYSQPTSVQQQGYGQDSYSGGYQAQPAYAQPASAAQSGYDHQQGYGSNPAYPPQDGSTPAYGTQGASTQVPPTQQAPPPVQASAIQQGYAGQPPSSNAASYPSQPGYGSQVPAGGYMQSPSLTPPTYGQPQGQKPSPAQLPPTSQAGYVQSGYGQPPPAQSGYPQVPPTSGYGSGGSQPGYGQPPAYGSVPPQGQGYGGAYSQPSAYSTESAAHGTHDAPSASPAVPTGVAKASPQS